MSFALRSILLSAVGAILLSGCLLDVTGSRGNGAGDADAGSDPFVSDDPHLTPGHPPYDVQDASASGMPDAAVPGPEPDGAAPERIIAEADIVQTSGDTLYALSRRAGLAIIDIADPADMKLLGSYQADGQGEPFEMYLRGNLIFSMYSSWAGEIFGEEHGDWVWAAVGRIEVLDVSNPEAIDEVGTFDLPGEISDTRIVGDILYAVAHQHGYCYGCSGERNATITSLSLAAPEAIAVVDQIELPDTDPYGWGRKLSVTATTDRMYVGSTNWDSATGSYGSVQVIDISNPAGDLVVGAQVSVAGFIESRWQMNEHAGVLRVLTQPWDWFVNPRIQTFAIQSSHELIPLGETDLILPRPEELRAVQFDGERGYAITFERTDPLFTIDLSDPANPRQMGELEIPGWVYHMVPRGDRLLGLGFDNSSGEGSLHVSLFDVSDLTDPTMITRAPFGGDWASLAEDQDRIHKAFSILDEQQLIMVPFSGWTRAGSCGEYLSGIQLIDFVGDSLTVRGVAPSDGDARRALLRGDVLFAMSDDSVRTFDIADRSAPRPLDRLELACQTQRALAVGDSVARLGGHWYTGAARLDIVPGDNPSKVPPLGSVDLHDFLPSSSSCDDSYLDRARLYAAPPYVVVASPLDRTTTRVVAIDASDPQTPAVADTIDVHFGDDSRRSDTGAVNDNGTPIAQVGNALAFRTITPDDLVDDQLNATLQVVDLSNPAELTATSLRLPDAVGYSKLLVSGSIAALFHWRHPGGDETKLAFYISRIDLSHPDAPVLRAPINVPGSLLIFDESVGRAITMDYRRRSEDGIDYYDCERRGGAFDPSDPDDFDSWWDPGRCTWIARTFHLVDYDDSSASIADSYLVSEGTGWWRFLAGEDRLFVRAGDWSRDEQYFVIDGLRRGALRRSDIPHGGYDAFYNAVADGTRLVFYGWDRSALWTIDAADMAAISLRVHDVVRTEPQEISIDGDRALCSLGYDGLQVVDLAAERTR